jgi:phosphatidylserine/phosphatidylglycerophosphate/cardiolipin synthase-like enzyme
LFKKLINSDVFINIGYGFLDDLDQISNIHKCSKKDFLNCLKNINPQWKYDALTQLETLENEYPNYFQLKFLGTHEKYLISDKQFAMIGSHNLLTSKTPSKNRETGLYFEDINLIQDLIVSFNNARCLYDEEDDYSCYELEAMGYNAFDHGLSYEDYLETYGYL